MGEQRSAPAGVKGRGAEDATMRTAAATSAASLPERMPRDHAGLRELACQLGRDKRDLLVLAPANDPYNADTPAKRRAAEWFAELWHRFGYSSGVHVRRVHYQAQATEGVMLPSGEPYVNTDQCWNALENAAKYARDLALIDPRLFADRRNPQSRLFVHPRDDPAEPGWAVWHGDQPLSMASRLWSLPAIPTWGLTMPPPQAGRVVVDGYDYEPDDQPYLLWLWCEKSTMDDILAPLCQRLGVNYTPGTGYTSKTRTAEMLATAKRHGKPLRVFVISDYDPAGSHMAAPIARNIEFYRDLIAPEVEIAVHHIGMTRDWSERYDLPRTPIKEDDRRRANFEAIHGEGCVELDALEALHPGALAEEMRQALSAYVDPGLPRRLAAAKSAAESAAADEWHANTSPILARVEAIRSRVNAIADRYAERLAALAEELETEMEPYRAPLAELWRELIELSDDPDLIQLPPRPAAELAETDESGWLYDSRRHWLEQLEHYRRRNGGGGHG